MRDFADTLELQLRTLTDYAEPVSRLSIVPPSASQPVQRLRPTRRPLLRRPVFTGGLTAAFAASAALAVVLTGSSAAGLPILETETSDASGLRSNHTLAALDVDFTRGHRYMTPNGSGWVFTTKDEATICISIPDRETPGSSGAACAPATQVEARGLPIELTGDRAIHPHATNKVAYLLPTGAHDVTLTTAGRTVALQTEAGVAVAWLTAAGTLTFRVGGRVERRHFEGPFEGTFATCDGRRVDLVPPKLGQTGSWRCE